MKDIQGIKRKYKEKLLQQYAVETFDNEEQKRIYCDRVAEAWAYLDGIIPENFRDYTIFDFNGKSTDKSLIPPDIASLARNLICQFCWGKSWKKIGKKFKTDDDKKVFFRNNSVILKRLNRGNNVAIFGKSDGPIGRTMVASIIMKEAIRLRLKPENIGHTYDWIDFPSLKDSLRNDTSALADCRSCDWLVVDDIIKNSFPSLKQRAYLSDLLDPFFMYRLRNNLPTILVFKFDIRDKTDNLESTMGLGIANVVNNKKTLKIPLCSGLVTKDNE